MLGSRSALLAIAGIGPTFGEAYASPATLPTGTPTGVAFSPEGNAVVVTHSTAPFITAYAWSSSGFGIKYANPSAALPRAPVGLDFSPSGSHIVLANSITSFSTLEAYAWSSGAGFGGRQTFELFSSLSPRGMRFHPLGTHIAAAGVDSGLRTVRVVPWTGSAFGASSTTVPSAMPSADARNVDFSPDGNFLGVVGTNLALRIFPFSSGTLGTPSIAGVGSPLALDFSTPGDAVVWGGGNSLYNVNFRGWSPAGFGATISAPALVNITSISFSPLNNMLAIGFGSATAPLQAFRWLGTSLGSAFADPATLPTGAVPIGRCIAWSPSGDAMVVCHQNPPYITAYKITAA